MKVYHFSSLLRLGKKPPITTDLSLTQTVHLLGCKASLKIVL